MHIHALGPGPGPIPGPAQGPQKMSQAPERDLNLWRDAPKFSNRYIHICIYIYTNVTGLCNQTAGVLQNTNAHTKTNGMKQAITLKSNIMQAITPMRTQHR